MSKIKKVKCYFKMIIIVMIVSSIIMMIIGVVMIVIFGVLGLLFKFCICFEIYMKNNIDSVK